MNTQEVKQVELQKCECEHMDHFDDDGFPPIEHSYMKRLPTCRFFVEGYGHMYLCQHCAGACLGEYIR